MAPMCPEEVDVFRIPHSRMKELVCRYLDMVIHFKILNLINSDMNYALIDPSYNVNHC